LAKAIVDNNTLEYECDDEDMELIFDCFDNSSGHIGIMNVYLELGLMPDEAFEAK
jgi:membrane-bound inhibitor of C-type lysozyme